MNEKVKVTWRTLCIITQSLMVHAIVLEAYIHFSLMIMTDHIFLVLLIKDLINKEGEPITTFKLAIGKKPSVSHLRVLFCPCVVRKVTAHIEKKALNVRYQAQKGFCGIFVGIKHHQKGYLVYVPSTRNIMYSYDAVFDESFSSALEYTSQPYAEAMAMRPAVSYIPCATS